MAKEQGKLPRPAWLLWFCHLGKKKKKRRSKWSEENHKNPTHSSQNFRKDLSLIWNNMHSSKFMSMNSQYLPLFKSEACFVSNLFLENVSKGCYYEWRAFSAIQMKSLYYFLISQSFRSLPPLWKGVLEYLCLTPLNNLVCYISYFSFN